ncbi:MAG: hypothetical protein FJZ96_02325 [Chloroflexi bacterium]|nr:hypothetical protein [Chloroflexota bacterium]
MRDWDPRAIMALGFVLVLLGAVLPFLIVMQAIESTIFLNFFAYTASFTGLMLGVVGAAFYVKNTKNKDK